jgi:T5orf172 domain
MIYFLQSVDKNSAKFGLVKIGTTIRFMTRLDELSFVHGELKVLGLQEGGYTEERLLHKQFIHAWREYEWFELSPDLEAYIQTHATLEIPDRIKKTHKIRIKKKSYISLLLLSLHLEKDIDEIINEMLDEVYPDVQLPDTI